jgi:8-oxo-dGTP pyrophosphatase MutT (NUDIX family)
MTAIRAAATVVLLRDCNGAQEVLLLRRNPKLNFAAGAWVFPGGAVDESERVGRSEEDAARLAAVRECAEEADLRIDGAMLQLYAHWLTPKVSPKRFSTWFYVQHLPGEVDVQVDGGEITESLWAEPADLLARHRRGELPLMPPTYVTLTELAQQRSAGQSVAAFAERPLPKFLPRMVMQRERVCFLYQEDAGYAAENADVVGARHRCYMDDAGCHYERSF